MATNAGWLDFRRAIVRPVLQRLDRWSPAAENLLVGTAAMESGLRRLRQIGGGPGRGVYQIEPATHKDVWDNFLAFRAGLAGEVRALASQRWFDLEPDRELDGNLFYATAIVRVIYLRAQPPLPHPDDVMGLAQYWKAFYNTVEGAGHPADFVARYPGGYQA